MVVHITNKIKKYIIRYYYLGGSKSINSIIPTVTFSRKRDTYPPQKKKKRVSLSPARRGPRTPSPSPTPKKLKGSMKKKKGNAMPKKGAQKKR